MRPAQIAREIIRRLPAADRAGRASMRPAQIAREILRAIVLCATRPAGFNEARANCAGNSLSHDAVSCRSSEASMRPAQIAREILGGTVTGLVTAAVLQ